MMVRVLGIATVVMFSSFFISCTPEEKAAPVLPTKSVAVDSKKTLASVKFDVPAANTVIDAEKAKKYADASSGLLLLAGQWSEKIEKAADQEKIEILNNYTKAQEQLCLRLGLAGMAEYNWLDSVAIKNSANAKVFEAAGVKLP